MHLTAVALTKEKDDEQSQQQRNSYQETGIFVTHTKFNSKNNNNTISMLFTICLLSLYSKRQQCLATFVSTTLPTTYTKDVYKPNVPSAPYECGSFDLRNNCNDFYKLTNCTVITGFLNIAQLPRNESDCDFSSYQFDNLREITDFLIINNVNYMTSIKTMFPNLVVIRGQQVFLNYALVVTSNTDLKKLEFKSLIAIQRGHVLLDNNSKLCYGEKINWSRLTLTRGRNTIIWDERSKCPEQAKCNGCKRDSCWSNDVCQKLENDSVLSLMQDSSECHRLCLGGCYNHTAQGCVVCKSWSDHGTCVDACPQDKYGSKHYLRCYTREECIQQKKKFIYKNTCVEFCPGGYKLNNVTKECDSCGGINNCQKICNPRDTESVIYISSLMLAESYKGCEILNATVMVNINEYIDHENLMEFLKDVREITGHLKINRSPYLKTLQFFQNLEKIHGLPLENKRYALIVYNNKNLSDLWSPKPGFELVNGGMYIHANDKLCNKRTEQYREKVKHDRSLDSVQTSDQEVLCAPAKLNLYAKVLNHNSLELTWPKDQTSAEVEIIYRPLNDNEVITELSELDTDVCKRINWQRELKFSHELKDNATHYSYTINDLEPHTRYASLVKTFNGQDITQQARSEIIYATTLYDIPLPANIFLKSKSYDSLHIEFSPSSSAFDNQVVDYYLLNVSSLPDIKQQLDTRNYCDEPILGYKDIHEDYDDCCTRREKDRKDQLFMQQLKKDFSCSLDQQEYCLVNDKKINNITDLPATVFSKRFEAWETNYTIRSLERFHLYTLQLQACNHAGCSSYTMLSTRTNYSTAADKIYDFSVCKMPYSYDYRVHFTEPPLPNGFITSYGLHFRYSTSNNATAKHNELLCITRLEHELNNFVYVARFNYTFNEAAIRVHSLGQHRFLGWFNITACPTTKLAGRGQGWNIFLIFFLIGAGGTVVWICYKRRYWRKIPQLRRYLPLHLDWRYLRPETDISEDRQILVDGFETVRFHNSPDEDMKYLVH